jgi:hypothetical protein
MLGERYEKKRGPTTRSAAGGGRGRACSSSSLASDIVVGAGHCPDYFPARASLQSCQIPNQRTLVDFDTSVCIASSGR